MNFLLIPRSLKLYIPGARGMSVMPKLHTGIFGLKWSKVVKSFYQLFQFMHDSNLERSVAERASSNLGRPVRRDRSCHPRMCSKGCPRIIADILMSILCCMVCNVFYLATVFWSHVRSPQPIQPKQNVEHSFKENQARNLSNLTVNINNDVINNV